MDEVTEEYFDSLEKDLRGKKDRSDELDELFQLSFLGDNDVKQRTSWCVAKMGQNKVPDMRILDILVSMKDDEDPEVRENVVWGIGEVAGAGIGDERSLSVAIELMRDENSGVRAMAAWAAGRARSRLGMENDEMLALLKQLLDDRSDLVRRSAESALEEELLVKDGGPGRI